MSLDARIALLEQKQAHLQSRNEIWHTISRYARGIDEQRQDDLEAIFTDDVVSQTHPWSQRLLEGKELVLKAFRNYRQAFQYPRRFITNEQIHVADDTTASAYAAWFVVHAHEGQSYYGWGTYDWDFRCENNLWKISKMIITVDCMTTLERGWGTEKNRVLPFPPRPRS